MFDRVGITEESCDRDLKFTLAPRTKTNLGGETVDGLAKTNKKLIGELITIIAHRTSSI